MANFPTDQPSYRLPRAVVPDRYVLELTPDLDEATFAGAATVTLRVDTTVSDIVFNAAELEISSASLRGHDGRARPGQVTLDAAEQRATVHFAEPIEPADGYRLDLEFTGILNDKLRGFYRSTFVDDQGDPRVIATTQFEPADARRAFPCWDEPDFKATFEVTLIVDENLTAISNGGVIEEEAIPGGRRLVRFAPTMAMSTYLVAFVVGPFELTEPQDSDGVAIRIAAPPGKLPLSAFAAEAARFSLQFLSEYFELPYPSDKIDHVAIPDFAFGAMENLGCVTYRETALLLDSATASQLELQRVATVVAHETAHMWFGDLVTMRWWNGIWLNEAFATFMELTTTDAFNPAWQVWTAFGAGKAAALTTDGLVATRPVEFAVGRPQEAEAMFDVLTYQKGGAVLKMLEQYLTPETFRLGIVAYLTKHRYGNTETTDLWEAIESVSGEPVRTIMDSWILQGGYPNITVTRHDDGCGIDLSQHRFVYRDYQEHDPTMWAVPVNLRASVDGEVVHRRVLLDRTATSIDFDGPVDWVIVNEGAWGFYRVTYAASLGESLGARLRQVCSPLERMSVIGDSWAGVVAGRVSLDNWVNLVSAIGDEEDPDVWAAVLGPLGVLDTIVADEDQAILQAFVRRIAGGIFARLGWEPGPDEPERLGITRARLLGALGGLGNDPAVQAEAASRHARFLTDRAAVAADLVTATVNVLAASGGEDAYEVILAEFRRAATPQDKIRYLDALGWSTDPALVGRTLALCLTPEVRSQDAPYLIGHLLGSRACGAITWRWIEAHWPQLMALYPHNILIRMLEGVTRLADPALAAQVHAFVESHDLPIGGPRVAQVEERMDISVALAGRIRAHIVDALC